MPIGLITIEKQLQGEKWVNTYGVAYDTLDTADLTDSALSDMGFGETYGPEDTDPEVPVSLRSSRILQAILTWERAIHFTSVALTKAYITDGKDNSEAPANTFATLDLALTGLRPAGSPPDFRLLAPGNTTLQINRVPATFSARRGRLFLRACMLREEVSPGPRRLVDFSSPTALATYQTLVTGLVASSDLGAFMSSDGSMPDPPRQALIIPKYSPPVPSNPGAGGELIGGTFVREFIVVGPVGRQVPRGRRTFAQGSGS